jgi:hypothetical protein
MLGHFRKAGVGPKRIVREFPVSKDAHVPVGVYWMPFGTHEDVHRCLQELLYLPFTSYQANLWM